MKNKPNILGVITARGGSKGLPGKNIKLLGDKPLIAYSIDIPKKSKLITHLIVSTDDKEIANVCKDCGADVPFIRPKKLAQDSTPHLPVMQHAIGFMEKKLGIKFDYAVIFQPTSPFRLVEDIDKTVQQLIDTGADSAVSLVKIDVHPIKAKKLDGDRVLPYAIPEIEGAMRQDFPLAYRRSSAVFAMRRDLLMEENRLYGDYSTGHIVPKERYIDIDDIYDWIKAEYMLEDLNKKGYEFFA